MFEQTFISSRADVRRPWPMAASLAIQTAFVAAVLAVPLFHTVSLAWNPSAPIVFIPVKPKVMEVVQRQIASQQTVSLRPMFRPSFNIPHRVPTTISDPGPEPMPFMPQGAVSGSSNLFADLGISMEPAKAPPVRPAAPAISTTPKGPLHVSLGVQAAKLIRQIKPVYPPLAKAARMSGVVKLQAIIGTDGRIRNLQMLSGPSLLVKAALEAVKEWQYEPTLLNGEPVEVITSIEVNFTLNQ